MQNLLKEIPQNLFDQIQNDVSLNFFMEKVKETLESLENQMPIWISETLDLLVEN